MFSKTSHIDIIEEIAKGLKAAGNNQRYLELGIAKAKCFNRVAPYFKNACCVDISTNAFEYVTIKRNTQFHGDTDCFFEENYYSYNLIFIDACHEFEQVKKDFDNSYKVLEEGGLIILHDTYPPSPEWNKHCQDAYKIRKYVFGKYESVTLPFYFGLTIVRKT